MYTHLTYTTSTINVSNKWTITVGGGDAHLTYVHLMYTHLTYTTSTSMFRNPSPSPSDTPYNVNVVNDNCWQWGCSFNVRAFDVHTNVVNNNCWQRAAFNVRAFDVHTFEYTTSTINVSNKILGGRGYISIANTKQQAKQGSNQAIPERITEPKIHPRGNCNEAFSLVFIWSNLSTGYIERSDWLHKLFIQ